MNSYISLLSLLLKTEIFRTQIPHLSFFIRELKQYRLQNKKVIPSENQGEYNLLFNQINAALLRLLRPARLPIPPLARKESALGEIRTRTPVGATPSRWCVYQFRHQGRLKSRGCKNRIFYVFFARNTILEKDFEFNTNSINS